MKKLLPLTECFEFVFMFAVGLVFVFTFWSAFLIGIAIICKVIAWPIFDFISAIL